ncbi:hypothetical protein BC629DRAFT_1473838 [Irpex lacteus]|nr:hypothetical protein BC629DRAFT_1473838 [Irpex lacteus]
MFHLREAELVSSTVATDIGLHGWPLLGSWGFCGGPSEAYMWAIRGREGGPCNVNVPLFVLLIVKARRHQMVRSWTLPVQIQGPQLTSTPYVAKRPLSSLSWMRCLRRADLPILWPHYSKEADAQIHNPDKTSDWRTSQDRRNSASPKVIQAYHPLPYLNIFFAFHKNIRSTVVLHSPDNCSGTRS